MKIVDRDGFSSIELDSRGKGKIILIVGASGAGKSIATDNIAYKYKRYVNKTTTGKKGTKVIYVTEKPQSPMENAFSYFERLTKRQLTDLDTTFVPETERIPENIEILHPFTFDFPEKKVPNIIKLYSFPLKNIDPLSFSALLKRDIQSPAVILSQTITDEMRKEDDLYSFLFRAFELTSTKDDDIEIKQTEELLKRNMMIPLETYGSKKDMDQIKVSFSPFRTHYFLQEENSKLNLDEEAFKKMINNTNITTIFTTAFIENERLRYFNYVEILIKLNKYIPKYAENPVLIILEEIKILLPKTASDNYEKQLIKILRDMLAGLRSSNVTIVATTQSYNETNSDFRSGIPSDSIILMKLDPEDIKALKRDFYISSENTVVLSTIREGQCVLFNQAIGRSIATKFKFFNVPFGHRESDIGDKDFIKMFEKLKPNDLISMKNILEEVGKKVELSEEKQMLRIQKYKESIKEVSQKQEKYIQNKEKVEEKKIPGFPVELPFIEKILDIEKKIPLPNNDIRTEKEMGMFIDIKEEQKKCYELAKKTPLASWDGRKRFLNSPVVSTGNKFQQMCVLYAESIEDYDFIKDFFQEKFLKTFFPDLHKKIYKT